MELENTSYEDFNSQNTQDILRKFKTEIRQIKKKYYDRENQVYLLSRNNILGDKADVLFY